MIVPGENTWYENLFCWSGGNSSNCGNSVFSGNLRNSFFSNSQFFQRSRMQTLFAETGNRNKQNMSLNKVNVEKARHPSNTGTKHRVSKTTFALQAYCVKN
jgi:hypothetical protein